MPGFIVIHRDILSLILAQAKMIERVFCCKIRRAKIEISIGNIHFQMRIVGHRLRAWFQQHSHTEFSNTQYDQGARDLSLRIS